MVIKSTGREKELTYGYELSEKEKKEFDYLSDTEINNSYFVKYRGDIIYPEFMPIDGDLYSMIVNKYRAIKDDPNSWVIGVMGESYFSGIWCAFSTYDSTYIIGRCYE